MSIERKRRKEDYISRSVVNPSPMEILHSHEKSKGKEGKFRFAEVL